MDHFTPVLRFFAKISLVKSVGKPRAPKGQRESGKYIPPRVTPGSVDRKTTPTLAEAHGEIAELRGQIITLQKAFDRIEKNLDMVLRSALVLPSVHDGFLGRLTCQSAQFSAGWQIPELWDVARRDGVKATAKELLKTTLTLTGSATNCMACTCLVFMNRHWPEISENIINAVAAAVESSDPNSAESVPSQHNWSTTNLGKCMVSMTAFHSRVEVEVQGSHEYLAQAAEAIAWLCAAIRTTSNNNGLMLSYPNLNGKDEIELVDRLEPVDTGDAADGTCWHKLFISAVIVHSPSVLNREGMGLELSFDDMIRVAAVTVEIDDNGSVALLGKSALIIPVKRMRSGIQWHLEVGDPTRLLDKLGPSLKFTEPLSHLRSERAFLGWDSSRLPVKVVLGTVDATLVAADSGASPATVTTRDNFGRNAGVTIKVPLAGIQVTGGANEQFGFFHPGNLAMKTDDRLNAVLNAPSDSGAFVYDNTAKRAWLVSQADMLLYIVHVRSRDSRESRDAIGYAVPGGMTAREVLTNARNEVVAGVKLEVFVLAIATALNTVKNTLRLPTTTHKRSTIVGSDLFSLAISVDNVTPDLRRAIIIKKGGGWEKIVRNSWVLICNGIGEAIQPVAANGGCISPIPQEKYYLAAMVQCLREVAVTYGIRDDQVRRVAPNLYRSKMKPLRRNCGGNNCSCVRVQKLTTKAKLIEDVSGDSAVVFGKLRWWELRV